MNPGTLGSAVKELYGMTFSRDEEEARFFGAVQDLEGILRCSSKRA